jgi:hypothetical protein
VVELTYTKLLRSEKSAPLVMLRHSLCKYVSHVIESRLSSLSPSKNLIPELFIVQVSHPREPNYRGSTSDHRLMFVLPLQQSLVKA